MHAKLFCLKWYHLKDVWNRYNGVPLLLVRYIACLCTQNAWCCCCRHARSLMPPNVAARMMHEREMTLMAFFLLFQSILQLAMTHLISGDLSCHCAWDTESVEQDILQWIGIVASVAAVCISGCVAGGLLFSNSEYVVRPHRPFTSQVLLCIW